MEKAVRSIQRAIDILLCFNWDDEELSLTHIYKKVNLSKSTTMRILTTLTNRGFLTKHPKKRTYSLGYNIYYLGQVAQENIGLKKVCYPIMCDIGNETNETVILYVLDKYERVCFIQKESSLEIRRSVKIGDRFSLWAGASGKCILAYLNEDIWEKMARKIEPLTEKTIVNPVEFINELKKIKKQGYAISCGEKYLDISCIAAPIFDSYRDVIGCLVISGPSFRFPNKQDNFIRLVTNGAKKISEQLGYQK